MIRFDCECGRQLQAREEDAGKPVLCPACQRQLTVPAQPPPSDAVQRERPIVRDEPEWEEELQPAGSSGKAVASLILGILALFCNVLASLPALILAILALRDIGRSRGRLSGQGLAVAGMVTACVCSLLNCGVLPVLLLPAIQKVHEAAERAHSQNNLKQMALAMHNYADTNFGTLPRVDSALPPNDPRAGQKPLLSWRVAILPFIGHQNLYSQFKLDEPWDSPHNNRLLGQMPTIYKFHGGLKTPPGHTHYQVFVGNGAAFEKGRPTRIPHDFTDGTSQTILIVEAENAVPWTKPEDVDFDPNKPMLPLMNRHFWSVFNVAMADGSVRVVALQLSENTFKAAITRNAGDVLGPDW